MPLSGMRFLTCGGAALCALAFLVAAARPAGAEALADSVARIAAGQPGTFAVYAAPSGQAPDVCLRCDEPINAASTIKLLVLDAAYAAFRDGTLKPDEAVTVHNRFHSLVGTRSFSLDQKEDSYDPLYAQAGRPVTVTELLRVMIQYSSNLATNLMIERLGVMPIRAVVARQGLEGIVFGRMIEDFDADAEGIRNRVTARGLGGFLQKLDHGAIVGPAESREMIGVMLGQTFNDIIPPGLPAGTPVAHKTGWVHGVRNDAAIVFLPNGAHYILVELSRDLPDEAAGIKVLNAISETVFAAYHRRAAPYPDRNGVNRAAR
ncbi:serine hydrolase [Gluconacetobacter aggeris]|uniref:beta-lactamase n=1 Tax=Gluconacetobacter aggeris TaxID=1286186 RepID=A0A7W4IQM3_9PROT|nr:serine hydrolase [Gluconacetobacter aggeris]MBB2167197.1 serine hydrolase [Gluconacetobacter aggeris]